MPDVRPEQWIAPLFARELTAGIEKIAEGDQTAFASFYDRTNAWVFGAVRRLLGDRHAAEEVTIDVYLRVWHRAGDYTPERGSPLAWLLMLARSRALDRLRSESARQRREELASEGFSHLTTEEHRTREQVERDDRRSSVRRALAELPEAQRVVLELAFFPGLTHEEIAARLEQPLGTIKTRIRLGMIKLKQRLGPKDDEL